MENKTGKYFNYASGEIVLVDSRSLIALSILKWQAQQRELNKEGGYVAKINQS